MRYAINFIGIGIGIGISGVMVPTPGLAVDPDLMAHWPLNGDATDASGNGHDGTIVGATAGEDRLGNTSGAMYFDGVDDRIDIGAGVKPLHPFTVSAWMNPSSFSSPATHIFSNDLIDSSSFRWGASIHVNHDGALVGAVFSGFATSGTRRHETTLTPVAVSGEWHLFTVVFDSQTISVYWDDAPQTTTSGDGTGGAVAYSSTGDGNFGLGDLQHPYYHGYIDDVRVYTRALTADEVAALYDCGDPAGERAWYADVDGDGFGDPATEVVSCRPEGHVSNGDDCNDASSTVNPDAIEVCDPDDVDEDCDNNADDNDDDAAGQGVWFADSDADGYGDDTTRIEVCDPPDGYVALGGDCADDSADVGPHALEVCDAFDVDEDCDGLVDDLDPSVGTDGYTTWYADRDGDGFGITTDTLESCDPAEGYVGDGSDCDDTAATWNPGAEDVPGDGLDQDCDGADAGCGCVNGAARSTWFLGLLALLFVRRRDGSC